MPHLEELMQLGTILGRPGDERHQADVEYAWNYEWGMGNI
jgi:hypothetical protein